MIAPSRNILLIAIAVIALPFLSLFAQELLLILLLVDAVLIGLVFFEGFSLRRLPVRIEQGNWPRLEINRETELIFRVVNESSTSINAKLQIDWPDVFVDTEDEVEVKVGPSETVNVPMKVKPTRRGPVTIRVPDMRITYVTRLSSYTILGEEEINTTVYPDLSKVAEYEKLRRHRALHFFGIHRMRMIGAGREFDQLREYQPDDDYSDINWKATARKREPITNIYQAERAQDVLICIDQGRMMGNPMGDSVALDYAVDAAMMLTHVCQRSGDRVGLATFGDTVTDYLKPNGGQTAATRVVDHLVNIHPEPIFPSYSELVTAIRVNQNRRAMVFLFTDLNDPQLATNLTECMPLISRRHVCVVISLRDAMLQRVAEGPAHSFRAACQVLAARELSDERASRTRELIKTGNQVLECDADRIAIDVINEYLSLKMRQMV